MSFREWVNPLAWHVGGPIGLLGFDARDRDQWQSEIAHFPEHAIQRGLVDHQAGRG